MEPLLAEQKRYCPCKWCTQTQFWICLALRVMELTKMVMSLVMKVTLDVPFGLICCLVII